MPHLAEEVHGFPINFTAPGWEFAEKFRGSASFGAPFDVVP
jgi:hypothetical protein